MRKVKNTLSSYRALLLAVTLLFLWPIYAEGATYKYIDKNGTVNFTDCYECIPKEYRNKVQRLQEQPQPQTPAKPSVEEDKRATKEPAPKEEARQSREAEERAAREKAEQERKLQARQEKERRIEELTQQIAAKEEEINNLRTTWMVYDRANLYRLTGEIEELKKEIRSIQDSLATD